MRLNFVFSCAEVETRRKTASTKSFENFVFIQFFGIVQNRILDFVIACLSILCTAAT